MATVTLTLPTMLVSLVGGPRRLNLDGDTVSGVLETLFARHPELRVHFYDETGAIREHVTCFHNDAHVRTLGGAVADGDRVTILQAVSGG